MSLVVGNHTFRHNPFGTLAYEYNRANELTHISQDYTSSAIAVSGTVSDLDEWGNPAELASVTVR